MSKWLLRRAWMSTPFSISYEIHWDYDTWILTFETAYLSLLKWNALLTSQMKRTPHLQSGKYSAFLNWSALLTSKLNHVSYCAVNHNIPFSGESYCLHPKWRVIALLRNESSSSLLNSRSTHTSWKRSSLTKWGNQKWRWLLQISVTWNVTIKAITHQYVINTTCAIPLEVAS